MISPILWCLAGVTTCGWVLSSWRHSRDAKRLRSEMLDSFGKVKIEIPSGPFRLKLYRDESGLWLFDDLLRGLKGEPLVTNATREIDLLIERQFELKDVDEAVLEFDGYSFPRCHQSYWLLGEGHVDIEPDPILEPEPGVEVDLWKIGHTYYNPDNGNRFWLCPNLLRYFAQPPETLYVAVRRIEIHKRKGDRRQPVRVTI